jgi:hypothetical protein
MPRATTCTFDLCSQGLLNRANLNKSQRNHLLSYHKDTPITFICPYTGKLSIFHRQHGKDMDYVCLCGNVFTLNTNLRRHYEACQVAASIARSSSEYTELTMDTESSTSSSSTAQVTPSSAVCEPISQSLGQAHTSESAYKPLRQSARLFKISKAIQRQQQRNSRSSTSSKTLIATPSKHAGTTEALGALLESCLQELPAMTESLSSSSLLQCQDSIIEQHQHYLQSASLQHSQILTTLTDHHHLFLQSLNKSTAEQHQQLLKNMSDAAMEQNSLMRSTFTAFAQSTATQHNQVLESMSSHHHKLLNSMSNQHSQLLQALSEQHRQLLQTTSEQHRQIISTTTAQHYQCLNSTTKKIEETISAMEGISEYQRENTHTLAAKIEETTSAVEGISEHQRENTHTLAAQERVLNQLTMYNLAQKNISKNNEAKNGQ